MFSSRPQHASDNYNEMFDQVLRALIDSDNEAADDVLLEALRLGTIQEKLMALGALIKRGTTHGLSGVIGEYEQLPQVLQLQVLTNIGIFHHALRECGRSEDSALRLAAMRLIALGKQGKLAYVLSENLYEPAEELVQGAVEALVALARWIAAETRKLQTGIWDERRPRMEVYREIMEQRPELEAAIARALDGHRGRFGQELVRAALLLCDWPGSKVLNILHMIRHNGQSLLQRRLQQPPTSEHVEAFLIGASHGTTRSHFGPVFAHIEEKPVLDALVRRSYLLKNSALQLCMHQVQRGVWWDADSLNHDLEKRTALEAGRVAEWIGISGVHDAMQDERLAQLLKKCAGDPAARLQILRVASRRKRNGSVDLIKRMINDPDERIARLAVREIVRRRPADCDQILLQLMGNAPESVRRIISRAIGQSSFDSFWNRFDRLEKPMRRQAGRAMLKVLPDAISRIERKLNNGPTEQRIKALMITQELGLAQQVRQSIVDLTRHENPKVRSKAVSVIGELTVDIPDVILDRVLTDEDARVRANAIEVLEGKQKAQYVPLLTQRARSANNRERANAIKALHRMKVGTSLPQLLAMLQDGRSEHRISALWAMKQLGLWKLIQEVGKLAKADENMRVRRYAFNVLKDVAEMINSQKRSAG